MADEKDDRNEDLEADAPGAADGTPEAGSTGEDDGLVTSAPDTDQVGSLLTDLLNEAKREVEQERATLEKTLRDREDEVLETQRKEEALRREQLQKELMEETRRRNEALLRKEREEAAAREAEEADRRRAERDAAEIEAAETAPPDAEGKRRPVGRLVLVGLLAAAGGAAAWYATQPQPQMQLPDIAARADQVVGEATREHQRLVAKAQAKESAREAEQQALKEAREARAKREAAAERRRAEKELRMAQARAREAEARKEAEEEARRRAAARWRQKQKEKERKSKIKIEGVFD